DLLLRVVEAELVLQLLRLLLGLLRALLDALEDARLLARLGEDVAPILEDRAELAALVRLAAAREEHEEEHGKQRLHRHRSASSSAVAASVLSSRYFTMSGVAIWSPFAFAKSPLAGRLPGTTTEPAGIVSGLSPSR